MLTFCFFVRLGGFSVRGANVSSVAVERNQEEVYFFVKIRIGRLCVYWEAASGSCLMNLLTGRKYIYLYLYAGYLKRSNCAANEHEETTMKKKKKSVVFAHVLYHNLKSQTIILGI